MSQNKNSFVPTKADEPIVPGIRIRHKDNWFTVIGPSTKSGADWELKGMVHSMSHGRGPAEVLIHLTEQVIRDEIGDLIAERMIGGGFTIPKKKSLPRRNILNAILALRGRKPIPTSRTLVHRGVLA